MAARFVISSTLQKLPCSHQAFRRTNKRCYVLSSSFRPSISYFLYRSEVSATVRHPGAKATSDGANTNPYLKFLTSLRETFKLNWNWIKLIHRAAYNIYYYLSLSLVLLLTRSRFRWKFFELIDTQINIWNLNQFLMMRSFNFFYFNILKTFLILWKYFTRNVLKLLSKGPCRSVWKPI